MRERVVEWARRRSIPEPRRLFVALSTAGAIFSIWFFGIVGPAVNAVGYDAFAYWDVRLGDLYARSLGQLTAYGAFRYSPPVAFVLAPLHALPWPVFLGAFILLLVAALVFLAGPWTLAAMSYPGVAISLYEANIDLLLAAAVVIGVTSPIVWVFAIAAKPTMIVCLAWFVVRREWRAVALIFIALAAVVVPTLLLRPDLWVGYVGMLLDNIRLPTGQELAPLWIRLPLAGLLAAWAAWSDRPWLLGISAALAQPVLDLRSASVGLAALYFVRTTVPSGQHRVAEGSLVGSSTRAPS